MLHCTILKGISFIAISFSLYGPPNVISNVYDYAKLVYINFIVHKCGVIESFDPKELIGEIEKANLEF